jgi:hypothetical protein
LEPKVGDCRGYFERYFYNSSSKQCEKFIYGGCNGNENNFETIEKCLNKCPQSATESKPIALSENKKCSLPAASGPCYAYFENYFFNKTSQKCEPFIYGGCGGNENRYESEEACQKVCSPKPTQTNSICLLEKKVGKCRGYFSRYFYNNETKKCEEFIYGGCDGNENNFETEEVCNSKCVVPVTSNFNIYFIQKRIKN